MKIKIRLPRLNLKLFAVTRPYFAVNGRKEIRTLKKPPK